MFSEIILEYHSVFTGVKCEVLLDILKSQGFECKEHNLKNIGIGTLHMCK